MLGIRHLENIPIDLWQGNPSHFATDTALLFETGESTQDSLVCASNTLTVSSPQQLAASLKDCQFRLGHIGIFSLKNSQEIHATLSAFRTFFEANPTHSVRRVTLIFETTDEYQIGREILFQF